MTVPGVYTPGQVEKEELVEVVARAIMNRLLVDEQDDQVMWHCIWDKVEAIDAFAIEGEVHPRQLATAAINAIREWEGR